MVRVVFPEVCLGGPSRKAASSSDFGLEDGGYLSDRPGDGAPD